MPPSTLTHLSCSGCAASYEAGRLWNLCPACSKPLLARYDLAAAGRTLTPAALAERSPGLWRYSEVLPVQDERARLSLGEGGTPLIHARRLGEYLGAPQLLIKDESLNPTGSFKARGLSVAVSRALELGATELAIPSAGNAAAAMSAYAAAAGLPAHVFMPADAPPSFQAECRVLGAHVTLVEGLITDCGARVRQGVQDFGWFDLSTLKEPYRVEGKKTLGYELAEQLDWTLPDVILYPTGGGTGLIGMWKAFAELEEMGLIGSERPRLVAVQSTGCAPIVQAFAQGWDQAPPWPGARTVADGLRVPSAIGDFLMLRALRESRGTAVAVPDEDMIQLVEVMGAQAGIFPSPEGAACLAALSRLRGQGWLREDEVVVLFNTGTGLKYTHLFQ